MKKMKMLKHIIEVCLITVAVFLAVSLTGFVNRKAQSEATVNDVLMTKSDIVANKKEPTMINTTAEVLGYCVVNSKLEGIEPEQVLYTLRVRILSLEDTDNELDFKVGDIMKLYSKEELLPGLFGQIIEVNIQSEDGKYWIENVKQAGAQPGQVPQPPAPTKYAFPNLDSVLVELYEKHLVSKEAALKFAEEKHIPVEDDLVTVIIEPVDSNPANIDQRDLEALGVVVVGVSTSLMETRIPIDKLKEIVCRVAGIDYVRLPYVPVPQGEK